MAVKHLRQQLVGFGAGLAVGIVATLTALPHAVPARAQAAPLPDELAALKADVELLKQKATDQSHVMADVAHHFSCLWFAGEKENWALADFFFSETQSHLRWAVRVIPVRKDAAGRILVDFPATRGHDESFGHANSPSRVRAGWGRALPSRTPPAAS